jgi:hypothetical protein
MKRAVLMLVVFLTAVAAGFLPNPVSAGQQFYLSTSPDGQTRIVVSQRLLRRVEDKLFFEYPVSMVDVRTGSRFELFTAGAPLVKETPRGTFTADIDAFRVEWAPENGDLAVVFLKMDADSWNVSLVNRSAKTQMDLLPLLKKGLLKKASSSGLECSDPKVSVFKWLTPLKPVFTLESECNKALKSDEYQEKHNLKAITHWVMYDSEKAIIKDCVDCEQEQAIKLFSKKPKPTPTPTPVSDDSTPTVQ